MKTKILGIFTAFMCLAMVTGAFAATPNNGMPGTVTKTINLASCPSTGYHWVASYNKSQTTLVKEAYKINNPNVIGSAGVQTFVFKGTPGTKIVLKYVKTGTAKPGKIVTYRL